MKFIILYLAMSGFDPYKPYDKISIESPTPYDIEVAVQRCRDIGKATGLMYRCIPQPIEQ